LSPEPATRGSYISTPNMSGYSNVDNGMPYKEPAYSSSHWLEQQESKSRRSKWIVIGSLVGLVALIVVGVAVGVTVSHNHHTSTSSSLSKGTGNSSSNGASGAVNLTNPNDPSTFVPDSNLKHSFYGLAYTPAGSQLPECGNSLDAVIEDVQLISQLTSRIRLYGADCNQSALVLEAIKQTKVDLNVYLAIYNVPNDGGAAYVRQRDTIVDALKTYGTDNVMGISVGNEFILDYLTDNGGGDDPNGPVGAQGASLLIANITDARQTFGAINSTLPIGTADAGSYFNTMVLQSVDYGMSNVHPWFADVSIDEAAGWTADFFQTQNVDIAQGLQNKPKMYIAETGWPTASNGTSTESNGVSDASVPNLQTFLDTFLCQANQNGTGYFYFEFFDEEWKNLQFGGVEGYWGLFNGNKTLKDVTLPDCHID